MKTITLTQAQFDWMVSKQRWSEDAEFEDHFGHVQSVMRNLMTGNLWLVKIKK